MPGIEAGRGARVRVRAGFTLTELLVALSLLAVLATLLFGALTAHIRLARLLARRVVEADAVRTAGTVLGGELRRASPADLRAVGPDSLALRAFRGIGTVCGMLADGAVVHFRGDREPDPDKDSLLWIRSGRPDLPLALAASQPFNDARCAGVAAGDVRLWRTEPPIRGPGLLLLFESGTYSLADGALRYRIGAGGRQPLTAELLVHPPSGFTLRAPNVVEYRLAVAGATAFPVRAAVHYPVSASASR